MGFSPLFYDKEVIIIQSNIIYNFDDLRTILIEKTNVGSYYLLTDDIYFEEIDKNTVITRDVIIEAKKLARPFTVMKHISFSIKEDYSTKQMYDFLQILKETTNIIVTIFNPKDKECNLLFISNKDDSILEKHIKDFIELED